VQENQIRQAEAGNACGILSLVHHAPRKIRQLVADLERAGFYLAPGGKGSHRKFRHERRPGALILSGKDGDDAQHYQEKQTRDAIREISQ
jgi:predicted RNA binding protein YcfA (HicA-like mRNA interferase family)